MDFIKKLQNKYDIVLASSSPRRKQLLASIGLNFQIIEPCIDEKSFCSNVLPQNYCQHLSFVKATNVFKYIENTRTTDIANATNAFDYIKNLIAKKIYIIISADTVVAIDNVIMNKPKDNDEAIIFLKKLSNNKHKVFTGVSVLDTDNGKINTRYAATDVYFRKLDDKEIIEYVNTGSPLDKAGGYGIQDDYGALFVRKIDGCYNNVVGLPIELLYEMLVRKI